MFCRCRKDRRLRSKAKLSEILGDKLSIVKFGKRGKAGLKAKLF